MFEALEPFDLTERTLNQMGRGNGSKGGEGTPRSVFGPFSDLHFHGPLRSAVHIYRINSERTEGGVKIRGVTGKDPLYLEVSTPVPPPLSDFIVPDLRTVYKVNVYVLNSFRDPQLISMDSCEELRKTSLLELLFGSRNLV